MKNKLYFYFQYAPDYILTRGEPGKLALLEDSTHMVRDREIYSYMMLKDLYDYGGSILNLPPKTFGRQVATVPLEKFHSGDLILVQTRPPVLSKKEVDDQDQYDPIQEMEQRHITITGQNLEQIILNNLRHSLFERCSRKTVQIKKNVFDKNKDRDPYTPKFRFVEFYIYPKRCWIEYFVIDDKTKLKPEEDFTLGFIIYLHQLADGIHDNLPGLLNIFSLGGTASILFSLLVYRKYKRLVREMISKKQPRVIMNKFIFNFKDYKTLLPPFLDNIEVQDEVVNDLIL